MTRLQADKPLVVGDATLIIIARLSIDADSSGHACWLQASKEPYALVIRDGRGLRALDMTGRRLAIEELIEDVPALTDLSNA
jgi:hypothetical protein